MFSLGFNRVSLGYAIKTRAAPRVRPADRCGKGRGVPPDDADAAKMQRKAGFPRRSAENQNFVGKLD